MASIEILFLPKGVVGALDLSLQEIIDTVEAGLRAHGDTMLVNLTYLKVREKGIGTALMYYRKPRDM